MANNQDFYSAAAAQRAAQLEAEDAALRADLAAHRANGDLESAATTVQQMADLATQKQNLLNLHDAYVRSQQPPQQALLTPEERAARPPERMDWNDVVELTRTSKYAKNIRPDDPSLVAGWQEAQRRRSRGE